MTEHRPFIAEQIAARPIERKIIERIVRALDLAGTPVVSVFDGEERTPAPTAWDVLDQVFNLDEAYLYTSDGGYVFVVMGQEWDTLTDFTLNHEDALASVMAWIDRNY